MAEGTRDYKRLEAMLKELKDSDQKREKEMSEIKSMINGLAQMVNRENGNHSDSILGHPGHGGIEGQSSGANMHTRYATKLEFLRFGGNGVDDWIFRVEQFFSLDKVSEDSKINVISLHLDGGALYWHKNFIKARGRVPTWLEYKGAIKARFGFLAYDDPMAEVKKLKQTGTLEEYMMAFDSLLDKAQLSDEQALSCFLAGLRHELEMVVRMFSPQTLQAAYSLAKLQDALKKDPGGMSAKGIATRFNGGSSMVPTKTVVNIVNPNNISVSKQSAPNIIARRPLNLTPKQLEERRLKNQCF